MKKLTILILVILCAGYAWAEYAAPVEEKKDEKPPEVWCPVTKYVDNDKCMLCHQMIIKDGKPVFGLKEVSIEDNYDDKPYSLRIISEDGKPVAYYVIDSIVGGDFLKTFLYLNSHPEVRKIIIEIHSGGGSVMEAWKIVGLIEQLRQQGLEISTRCYGIAASAGGILLIAGDIGNRHVSPTAEIMIHKVWNFSMFSIDDPDSAEDKADVLKHFQSNINEFIASRTKITVEEINSNTFHKMWWMTGAQAIRLGVADHLILKKTEL